MVMPPMNWDLAMRGLHDAPGGEHAEQPRVPAPPRCRRRPCTSANWAPNEYLARSGSASMASAGGRPARAARRAAWRRRGPGSARAARGRRRSPPSSTRRCPSSRRRSWPGGSALSPIRSVDARRRPRPGPRRRWPAARCARRSRCPPRRSTPGTARRRRHWSPAPARPSPGPGRSRRPRRSRSASGPSRRAPGRRIAARPAEPRGALAQAGHQVAAGERPAGLRVRRRARSGSAVPPGRCRRRSASSSMADSSANMPGHSPGARIQDGVGTSSRTTRWVVRRCGAAYMCRVATADCSVNSLQRGGLVDDVVARRAVSLPSGAGAEPHPLDRRGPVAGHREHLLPGDRALDRPPDHPGGHRREDHVGPRHALGAEPAAHVLGDHPDLLRARSPNTRGDLRRPPGTDPGWRRTRSAVSPCHAAMVACGSIGLLCSAGRPVGRRRRGPRRRRTRRRSRRAAVSVS